LVTTRRESITILGSSGGVARAVLSLLNHAAGDPQNPVHERLHNCDIHLVDRRRQRRRDMEQRVPHLSPRIRLHSFDLRDTSRLRRHLRRTKATLVIDVSWADTIEMLACCDELGIPYVNSALENTDVDENEEEYAGFPLIERYRRFEQCKSSFRNITAILCSGMNPGVVQWMALEVLKRAPEEKPLGVYIVEEDTSFFADPSAAKPDTLYTTWSPECFLDEAVSSYPMLVQGKTPLVLYHEVYELDFVVRLGEKEFCGRLMPHEEALTLGRLLGVESGFLYKVNDHTTGLIQEHLGRSDDLWEREMAVLDPAAAELDGSDLVGVLVVYPDKERYMYNVIDNKSAYARYGVNATYLQVASGIFGAVASLWNDSLPLGAHYVDELLLNADSRYGEYVTLFLGSYVTGENATTDGTLLQRMRNQS